MAGIEDEKRIGRGSAEIDRPDPRIDRALQDGTEVAVPLDIFAPETLATMMTVSRRPPELLLGQDGQVGPTRAEDVSQRDLQDATDVTTPDLGYRVISLMVRREQEAFASGDPSVRQGFVQAGEAARMMEHLHVLRTRGAV